MLGQLLVVSEVYDGDEYFGKMQGGGRAQHAVNGKWASSTVFLFI